MPPKPPSDPRSKYDRAWRVEEHAEIEELAARALLDHARKRAEARHGPGLGLDGAPVIGIPTPLAAQELRRVGNAAASLSDARAELAVARQARLVARQAAGSKKGKG
jgi:hypothetical protein